jgi:pimeloyl-ACP methyl ester carboxylesterase
MIDEAQGRIDYDEVGSGPAVVLLPGSCSTGAAWRPVIAAWGNQFRSVTTSLLGYGGTSERRAAGDPSNSRNAEAMESVIRRAGGRVHLVGHSFGGLVALAVALAFEDQINPAIRPPPTGIFIPQPNVLYLRRPLRVVLQKPFYEVFKLLSTTIYFAVKRRKEFSE